MLIRHRKPDGTLEQGYTETIYESIKREKQKALEKVVEEVQDYLIKKDSTFKPKSKL